MSETHYSSPTYSVSLTGSAGLVYGGISGVIRSPHPVIHSISCGIHWFACGASFWCELSPRLSLIDLELISILLLQG